MSATSNALRELSRKHPFLMMRLELALARAAASVPGDSEAARRGRGGSAQAVFSADPDGNHGDNLTHPTDKAVL